jgi:hypothetical protein
MTRENIGSAADQAHKVESILRVMSMAIDGEQICATSFTENGGGSLIDLTIEMMGELIEKIHVLERTAASRP